MTRPSPEFAGGKPWGPVFSTFWAGGTRSHRRERCRCRAYVPLVDGERVNPPKSDFDRLIEIAGATPFSGWDFSALEGRWKVGHPSWDYRAIAREHIAHTSSLLDLGTGGGEFLATLAPLPPKTLATEGYPPNLEVARRRLAPLGVRVLAMLGDLQIPMPDASVHLVLDRHEEFDPQEVHRVLLPGGRFVTQQVGASNCEEVRTKLGVEGTRPTNAVSSSRALGEEISRAGFDIERCEEVRTSYEFLDVGALVYFLRAAPWEVPGFSLTHHRKELEAIHHEIKTKGSFRATHHLLLVIAQRSR